MTTPERTFVGLPHAPWMVERAKNLQRLLAALEPEGRRAPAEIVVFAEKAPWPERSLRRWQAAVESGAAWFLQLEDDVLVPEDGRFWPSLHAMQDAWGGEVVCLAATHSMGPIVVSHGRRSYKTPKILGWAWMAPMGIVERLLREARGTGPGSLARFVAKVEAQVHPVTGRPGVATEDAFLAETFVAWGLIPRHPCPTIADQLHFPSTLGTGGAVDHGFDDHTNTQASVTWRDFSAADMAAPEWWRTPFTFLPVEWTQAVASMIGPCMWCGQRLGIHVSRDTCTSVCKECVGRLALKQMGFDVPSALAAARSKAEAVPVPTNGEATRTSPA